MIIHLPDSLRFGVVAGTIECADCEQEEFYSVQCSPIDADELMSHVWNDVGFSDQGNCPTCAKLAAIEEKGEAARKEAQVS